MGLNLHGIVRGAIGAVNPDSLIAWRRSTGSTTGASGAQTPTYAADAEISAQVQPSSGDDLKQIEYLNLQGTFRTVYAFGSIQGIVRPELKGGDLLVFPLDGATLRLWKVVHVLETWRPDAAGWCSVVAALQDGAP
jgi:hypothetical protein